MPQLRYLLLAACLVACTPTGSPALHALTTPENTADFATPEPVFLTRPSSSSLPAQLLTNTPVRAQTPTPTATETPRPLIAPTLLAVQPGLITSGNPDLPYIALTFDLCQKPEYPAGFDEGILAALESAGTPATFFVGGDWARTHPAETQRLAGNPLFELGNHSYTHPDLPDLSDAEIISEIRLTQQTLYDLTGEQPRLFRLPSGLYNQRVLDLIAGQGLLTIQWDVVTADPVWDNDAANINRIVRDEVHNGAIIIMHANGRGWHTAEALPDMIEFLISNGYRLVTVSQMLGWE